MPIKSVSYKINIGRIARLFSLTAITMVLVGCAPAPSIVLFGASFPDWLLCAVGGVIGMSIIHFILTSIPNGVRLLSPAVVVWPCVTALIAMILWLLIFPH